MTDGILVLRGTRRRGGAVARRVAYMVLLSTFIVTTASAQEMWTCSRLGGDVDEAATQTFSQLLKAELSKHTGISCQDSDVVCEDAPCAQQAAVDQESTHTLFGSLGTLGSEIVVTLTLVDAKSGQPINSQKMTIDRLEDLDSVAERMGTAFALGGDTKERAELGNITAHEAETERRREGALGFGLRLGGLIPIGEAGFANDPAGGAVDVSLWYETSQFAIAPRVGFRFGTDFSDDEHFFEMPIDIAAYYILTTRDFAPFVGGGAGLRYMSQETVEEQRLGTVLTQTHDADIESSAFGFGAFARMGLLLARTYTVRVAVTVDYNIAVLELNNQSNPQSLTAGVSVIF
jgi:hypothetical protein